jgi:type IV pilus assembly protein PilC
MVRAAVVERFCRTLADLLAAGVPIGQTFTVVIETTSNRVYRKAIRTVMAAMGTGEGICRPLEATGLFPPIVIQMVRVGEETGSLDRHLSETASMAGEDLDYRIKKMTAVIEPILIIFVGLMVGFVAVTMVTTIYSLAGGYK